MKSHSVFITALYSSIELFLNLALNLFYNYLTKAVTNCVSKVMISDSPCTTKVNFSKLTFSRYGDLRRSRISKFFIEHKMMEGNHGKIKQIQNNKKKSDRLQRKTIKNSSLRVAIVANKRNFQKSKGCFLIGRGKDIERRKKKRCC